MPKIDESSPFELVTEPSDEVLRSYATLFNTTAGKFIRFGGLVLVAPIDTHSLNPITHYNMAEVGFRHPDLDLADRVKQASERVRREGDGLRCRKDMSDAGQLQISVSDEGALEEVRLFGKSGDYGRANLIGRIESGDAVSVYLTDPNIQMFQR